MKRFNKLDVLQTKKVQYILNLANMIDDLIQDVEDQRNLIEEMRVLVVELNDVVDNVFSIISENVSKEQLSRLGDLSRRSLAVIKKCEKG